MDALVFPWISGLQSAAGSPTRGHMFSVAFDRLLTDFNIMVSDIVFFFNSI